MAVIRETIVEALGNVNDPELKKDLVSLGMIKEIAIEGETIRVNVELTTPACPMKDTIRQDVEKELLKLDGVSKVEVEFSARVSGGPKAPEQIPGIKNAIAIGAGKGGVGKSTIAVLTALGLQREGAKVGLLDADVFGPSIPKMLGVEEERPLANEEKIIPIEAHGIKIMSIGFLAPPDKPIVWRGPMVHGAIKQLIEQVEWGELDYLIVDLPPGTGDVPLTLSQTIPMTGAVIVCTPQEVALLDAVKALRMYELLDVNILGIIENMSYFRAPDTGKEYDLFGRGGAKRVAERLDITFLGEIPINVNIRTAGDSGSPVSIFEETDDATREGIMTCIRNLAGRISVHNAGE